MFFFKVRSSIGRLSLAWIRHFFKLAPSKLSKSLQTGPFYQISFYKFIHFFSKGDLNVRGKMTPKDLVRIFAIKQPTLKLSYDAKIQGGTLHSTGTVTIFGVLVRNRFISTAWLLMFILLNPWILSLIRHKLHG